MKSNRRKRGFTLIEFLVVVLIVAILAAIAVPQYQKAVLKSRFSSLMPTTKSVRDGQEIYYMTHGHYADEVSKLDVTTTNTDDMTITVSGDMDYAYTMATRPSLNNNLIMYQKHSVQFPDEIHCEAKDGNLQAQALCQSMGSIKSLGHILHDNYTTYLLQGNGAGFAPGYIALLENISCANATNRGFTCEPSVSEDGKTASKKVCNQNICVIGNYNENGKMTSKKLCNTGATNCYAKVLYDDDGNPISEAKCNTWNSSTDTCATYDYVYEFSYEDGFKKANRCKTSAVDTQTGTCEENYGQIQGYQYDTNGNITSYYSCEPNASGQCTQYNISKYTYDENGNVETYLYCPYSSTNTTCGSQQFSYSYTYTYDTDGILRQSSSTQGYTNEYFYDDYGNLVAFKGCSSSDCSNPYAKEVVQDENGNVIALHSCNYGGFNTETKKCSGGYTTTYDIDFVGYPNYLPNL